MTQGALFSMAKAAARENAATNVRFNEILLSFRVETDDIAVQNKVTKSTDFGKVYELLLDEEKVRSSRVRVDTEKDMSTLKYKKLF